MKILSYISLEENVEFYFKNHRRMTDESVDKTGLYCITIERVGYSYQYKLRITIYHYLYIGTEYDDVQELYIDQFIKKWESLKNTDKYYLPKSNKIKILNNILARFLKI